MQEESGLWTIASCGWTETGNCRIENEDSFFIASMPTHQRRSALQVGERATANPLTFLMVADGSGGGEAGRRACDVLTRLLYEALKEDALADKLPEALRVAVEQTNAQMFSDNEIMLARQNRTLSAALTVVLMDKEQAYFAQLGDSRAYLLRDGQLLQLTVDQTLVGALVHFGQLTPEEAKTHPYANVVLQVAGVTAQVKVGLTQARLCRRDRLLVCSDGVWRDLEASAIQEALKQSAKPEDARDRLLELASQKEFQDNMTVVVADVQGAGFAEAGELAIRHLGATFDDFPSFSGMNSLSE